MEEKKIQKNFDVKLTYKPKFKQTLHPSTNGDDAWYGMAKAIQRNTSSNL